ncbi:TetR/AcrR family transcriptional regulator [Nocardia sp. NPDC058518]|uniref:TetR/AcrR family transcriptional regulator n=1 Tax=Nocardia sp. NPDC058518 TaxID=3346534 RepID=UPI00365E06AC
MGPEHSQSRDPRLRADAQRNRDQILRAARETFAVRGIDAPLTTIARRAGVGAATLYRRFPTRETLVAETFAHQFGECTTALDDALADPDPWHGLRRLIGTVCALQAADRGFTQAFLARHPHAVDSEKLTDTERKMAELVHKCRRAGKVRPDLTPDDITLAFIANAGVITRLRHPERASARLAAQLLRAFATDPDHPLPSAPALELLPLLQSQEFNVPDPQKRT